MNSTSRAKSSRVLSSTGRHTSSPPKGHPPTKPFQQSVESLKRQNRTLKEQILKIKEINLQYATLLNRFLTDHHSNDGIDTSNIKRLMEKNKQVVALNTNIKEELEIYQKREQQFEKLENYLQANKFANLNQLIARFQKEESIIQSQRLKISDLETTIEKLKVDIADKTEVSGLKKTIKKMQDQNQKLQAKCTKLLFELEKTVKASNMQKIENYQTQMYKLRELERRDKHSFSQQSSRNHREKQNRGSQHFYS